MKKKQKKVNDWIIENYKDDCNYHLKIDNEGFASATRMDIGDRVSIVSEGQSYNGQCGIITAVDWPIVHVKIDDDEAESVEFSNFELALLTR